MGHVEVGERPTFTRKIEAATNRRKAMLAAIFASIALALAGLVGLAGHHATARNDDDDE
jgi:hypothetical protein